MPNRILRDGILTSERVNALNWEAEVFYRRLMSVVDDFGRYTAHPSLLRAALFPLKLDSVRDANMERLLAVVEQARLVRVYVVEGKAFLEMLDFKQQVRAKESKYPPPPVDCAADAKQVHSTGTAPAPVFGVGDVSEDGGDAGKPAARKRASPKTSLPEDFGISERVKAWAAEKGHTRLQAHLESFIGKAKAKGYTYVDWDEAFMSAIRDNWAKLDAAPAPGSPAAAITTPSRAPDQTREYLDREAQRQVTPVSAEKLAAAQALRDRLKGKCHGNNTAGTPEEAGDLADVQG